MVDKAACFFADVWRTTVVCRDFFQKFQQVNFTNMRLAGVKYCIDDAEGETSRLAANRVNQQQFVVFLRFYAMQNRPKQAIAIVLGESLKQAKKNMKVATYFLKREEPIDCSFKPPELLRIMDRGN